MKLSFWDILASMVMLGGLALATIFVNIFVNPYTFINPFPPPTPVAALNVPTLTASPRSLPNLWTSTPETTLGVTSRTPSPTATVTGTRLVLPTATVTRTRTPLPTATKTITLTPNRTLTSIAYKTATKTSTSSSDTTAPTNPGTPTTSSSTSDSTPTFTWSASSDSGSGIDYYEIAWGNSSECGGTIYHSDSNSWTSPTITTNTTYYICVRAVDNSGNQSSWTSTAGFYYSGSTVPSATTNAASSIATTSATLNGTVNANTLDSTVTFQYGLTTSYGTTVAASPSPVTGSTNTSVSAGISSLTSNTTYHFRVVAVNSLGTTYGSDVSFTTLALPTTTTITSDAADPSVYGGSYTVAVTVTGTGTPTGSVSVGDGTGATCVITLSGGSGTCNLTTSTAGSKTLTATYSGDSTFAASSDTETHTVNKATPVITFGAAPTPTYLGGNFTVSATTTNTDSSTLTYSASSGPCALVSGATFSSSGAGTCVAQADGAATTNFNAATQTQSVTVAKATPVITFGAAPTPTYLGGDFTVSASTTNTDSSTLTYSYVSGPCAFVSGTTFSSSGAGTCVVQADGAASTNFNAATQTQSVTIAKATPVITFGAAPTPTYLGGDFTVSASTTNTDSSTLTYSYVSGPCAFVSGTTFSSSGAGTCVVQADGAATTNFNAASQTQSVTIAKANQAALTVVVTPSPVVYGTPSALSTTGGSGTGAVTYSSGVSTGCSVLGSTLSVINVDASGTCVVSATKAADIDYNSATSPDLTVPMVP